MKEQKVGDVIALIPFNIASISPINLCFPTFQLFNSLTETRDRDCEINFLSLLLLGPCVRAFGLRIMLLHGGALVLLVSAILGAAEGGDNVSGCLTHASFLKRNVVLWLLEKFL